MRLPLNAAIVGNEQRASRTHGDADARIKNAMANKGVVVRVA